MSKKSVRLNIRVEPQKEATRIFLDYPIVYGNLYRECKRLYGGSEKLCMLFKSHVIKPDYYLSSFLSDGDEIAVISKEAARETQHIEQKSNTLLNDPIAALLKQKKKHTADIKILMTFMKIFNNQVLKQQLFKNINTFIANPALMELAQQTAPKLCNLYQKNPGIINYFTEEANMLDLSQMFLNPKSEIFGASTDKVLGVLNDIGKNEKSTINAVLNNFMGSKSQSSRVKDDQSSFRTLQTRNQTPNMSDLREIYKTQIQRLNEMGYHDENKLIQILIQTRGDLEKTITLLFD